MNAMNMPNDLSALYNKREEIKSKIQDLQGELKILTNSLKDMFDDTARMQLAQQGKDFGQTSMTSGDYKVTLDYRKRVELDQDELVNALNGMDPDTARHFATVKYSVAEAKFQNAPPEIKASLSEARTVSLQGVTVDIKKVEGN